MLRLDVGDGGRRDERCEIFILIFTLLHGATPQRCRRHARARLSPSLRHHRARAVAAAAPLPAVNAVISRHPAVPARQQQRQQP